MLDKMELLATHLERVKLSGGGGGGGGGGNGA
jgi:hypothetical protein